MRLDKFVSQCSTLSRKEVKIALRAGRIKVNAERKPLASRHILTDRDEVMLDGQILRPQRDLYLMMNKPANYVCATQDSQQSTVIDLLYDPSLDKDKLQLESRADKIQIVGRLDKDTTGLLLLTSDGGWNHRLTAPSRKVNKTYLAELAEPMRDDIEQQFKHGIHLKSDDKPTLPALLQRHNATLAEVRISEGRYHQIKRMFAACDNRVTQLKRTAIADLKLDDNLLPGQFRELTQEELQLLEQH
jgi:16S rRNA pseudouridine516 synthase